MELSFRPLDPTRDLLQAVQFRRDSFADSFGEDVAFDEARYVHWLKERSARDPHSVVLVMRREECVGLLELGTLRKQPWHGYLQHLSIAEAVRGEGVGYALDEYVTMFMRGRGIASVYVRIADANERGLSFLTAHGWSDLGKRDASATRVLEKRLAPKVLDVLTLETPSLWLRALSELDAPSYERNFANYDVIRQLARTVPWPYPVGGVQHYFQALRASSERWCWGIFLKESPLECVGAIDLWREGKPENRGFWLAKHAWGKGYMTEACHAVNSYAFDKLGFERLVLSNASGNVASRRVKEKTGARFVELAPGEFVDPELTEQELWELTREQWQAAREAAQ